MNESSILCRCSGGTLQLPTKLLNDRLDGGNLVVNPPRPVWERSELTPVELTHWSFLVAASGRAMLDVLPQLEGGCINYWEAGNWALNEQAPPNGPKNPREHRRVHLHLLGRNRHSTNPNWQWGEAPRFQKFVDSEAWSSRLNPLNADECRAVALKTQELLAQVYGIECQLD